MDDTNTSIFTKSYRLTINVLPFSIVIQPIINKSGAHPEGRAMHFNLFLRAARQKKDFRSYPLRFGQKSIRFL